MDERGWIKPKVGLFEISAPLQAGDVTTFWVYARDEHGQMLDPDISEFKGAPWSCSIGTSASAHAVD